ncbi:MAG: prephenate dehydratase [Myxococcota bacterium]
MSGKDSGKNDPSASKEIQALRAQIDEADLSILKLLNARARLASEIGRIKSRSKRTVYIPGREQEIFKRLIEANEGPFPSEGVRSVFREIVSASRALEQPLRVAYFGPEATFTHLASLRQFGASAEHLPRTSIADVFDAVERRQADYGVVPVENSTEGVVSHTLDLFVTSDLTICAEVVLPISHDLLSQSGKREDVERVVSHPQALAQCRKWLEKNLPGVPRVEVHSTSSAARTAKEDPTAAAISSRFAGDYYGLRVVESKIEDNVNNVTRFLVIGHETPPPGKDDVTSLVFSIKKDEVGALYHVLEAFSVNGINLSKIESRPMKNQAWEYVFFLDLQGHVADPAVTKSLKEVEKRCFFLKVLGSYPRAA